jgi:ketosteroid isomerase-like protein
VLAVVRMDARGRASGAPLDGRFFHVFRVRDGRVADFAWFARREEALEDLVKSR